MHLLKHGLRGNGHVHVAVDLACAQSDAGHQVVFASGVSSYDDLLRAHGVKVATLPKLIGVAGTVRTAVAILALVRQRKPNIIHAHMMSSAALGFPAAKLIGARLLTTVHNSFDRHSVLMRLGKMVVAVSEAERQLLISRGFRPERLVTVLNGSVASPREDLPLDSIGTLQGPCVLTLSGLHRRKAVDDVISAFAELASDFPEWHLNIVGWGPDRKQLEAQVSRLGLTSAVHFLGSTSTPREVLEAAEVFAIASLADPCPLTVAEARAAACAIVGTQVGGIPELLDDGAAGQLVPPRNPVAFARALRPLMADPAILASWQARARAGAEYFTVQRMSEDYLRVYESVRHRKSRARV